MGKKMLFKLMSTICFVVGFSQLQAQVNLVHHYENKDSAKIGRCQNITFKEGGFSSLVYIPGTNGKEFWTVTDRGVNIEAENGNANAKPSDKYANCKPTYDKIYPFPNYAPKIMRLKVDGDKIKIIKSITIKRPD